VGLWVERLIIMNTLKLHQHDDRGYDT